MFTRMVVVDAQNVIRQATLVADDYLDPESQNFWPVPEGMRLIPHATAGIGWTFDGMNFFPPPENPAPAPTPAQLRLAEFLAQSDRADLAQRLANATPAQIDTWIDNNVTSLAAARNVLKALVKFLVF